MEIVYHVLYLSLIAVGLSILIIIAEKYLNDYGVCNLDINDGEKVIQTKGGNMLLGALASENIYIPSACGGKATCGLCKLSITEGAGPILPTEEPYLSKDEIEKKVRLSCQVKVKNDLKLKIPKEIFSIRQFSAKVTKIEDLTYDIKEVFLKFTESVKIDFKAGQYMQLHSKPYDKIKEGVIRAYSISSPPYVKDGVEHMIRLVPGGICTTFVHQHLKQGDEVTLSGPYGDFYLRGEGCDELIFIAGGSGLAPIKSLVLDIIEKKIDKKMVFYFGAVSKKDLFYVQFFEDIAKKHTNFRYVPALSKPEETDNWKGETGLITDVLDRHVKDSFKSEAYLCGSPGMINACITVLNKKGFTDDKIFFDKFS